jgi:hypothetical protein
MFYFLFGTGKKRYGNNEDVKSRNFCDLLDDSNIDIIASHRKFIEH